MAPKIIFGNIFKSTIVLMSAYTIILIYIASLVFTEGMPKPILTESLIRLGVVFSVLSLCLFGVLITTLMCVYLHARGKIEVDVLSIKDKCLFFILSNILLLTIIQNGYFVRIFAKSLDIFIVLVN